MITPPLHRSGLRLWGALLLIGLLLTGVVSRVAADFATATATITAPTQGVNLNGAVQLVAQGSTVAAPFEWRDGVFTIQETPSGATAQIRLDQPSGNQWTAQFLPPLAGGDYTVQFHGNLVKTDDGNYSGRAATPVSFHVGQGVANPTTMHRVVNNGNLCGCRSGCAQTRSSTLPRNGDQSWEVPVTSWSYRGWSVPFSLTYHSVGTADPALPAGMDLAHLSERNGKWSHTFAQWVEVVSNGSALKAVWYNGGETRAFSQVSEGIYKADDSYTDILTGGGVINSPSGQASANQAWFRITDGEGTQYRFEDVQWVTTANRDFPRYRLKWIIDRWGRKLELAWSGSRLLSVKDTFNRGLTFTYSPADDTGMLTAVSDPALRTHTLTYQSVPDESGTFRKKLTGVTVLGPAMDGQSRPNYVWAFEYGDRSAADGVTAYGGAYTGDLVTRKVEPGGEATNYFYEAVNLASGRPTSGDWDGRVRRMEWNSQGTGLNVTQRIERQGNRLLYPGGESVLYEYSAPQEHPDAHDVKKITDETTGEYVEYAWDDEHNPTAVRTHVEAAQSTWLAQATYTRDPNTDRITRIRTEKARVGTPEVTEVWLNLRNQPLQVVQYADPTNAPLDPTNLVTTFQYDLKDNLTHVHAAPHRTGETLTTVLTYTYATDGHGDNPQPTSVLDPVGNEELAFYPPPRGSRSRAAAPPTASPREPTPTAAKLKRAITRTRALPGRLTPRMTRPATPTGPPGST